MVYLGEERREMKKSKFVDFLYSPPSWIAVMTFFFLIFTFTVKSIFITPLRSEIFKELSRIEKKNDLEHLQVKNQVTWNLTEIQTHKQWCDVTLTDQMNKRPTEKELALMIEPIRADICSLKKMQENTSKEFKQSLEELKNILIKKLNN